MSQSNDQTDKEAAETAKVEPIHQDWAVDRPAEPEEVPAEAAPDSTDLSMGNFFGRRR